MRQLLSDTLKSTTAITFVDVLAILRGIRAQGQAITGYQKDLLALLDHPAITAKARDILENTLEADFKKLARQRQRAQTTVQMKDRGKSIRMTAQRELLIELKSQQGFYWEPCEPVALVFITSVIGTDAKPGHETFRCIAQQTGSEIVRFELKADARLPQKDSLRTAVSHDFFFELTVEHHA